jgi:thioredoxin 1
MKQVLYFSAKWCTACQTTTPIVESLKKSSNAPIAMIDVDYDVSLTEQYNVKSVPTTIVLENDKEVTRFVGSLNIDSLRSLINN